MTSPPYYALRDYGMEAQIGRETTPKEYISRLTEVFTEVRRVLRPDGTLWLNISDTYAGKGNQGDFIDPKNPTGRNGQAVALNNKVEGCKPKDMIGIPWMLAFALRDTGWYLRNDIIWMKDNPMPESVKDRCARCYEHIFLFSKSKKYFFDYGDNRLNAEAAVKSVLEQFSPERVRYVLANTIQQKNFDGRIPQPLKEWAKSVDVCPENASRFLVDKLNPGLTALFVDAFRQQTEPKKEVTSEKTEERDPEVVAWENDEITSIEVKTVEVKSPFAPLPEEAAKAPKAHRLTAEEKEIKVAVMDTLKGQIAYNNDGMRASYRASNHSFNLLARNGVKIEGNTVTQNGEPLFKIHRRHAARKTQGCYRELLPTLEYIKQEQKQEKPSIRDQLKAAAKTQPEKKSPVKSKTHDMEL